MGLEKAKDILDIDSYLDCIELFWTPKLSHGNILIETGLCNTIFDTQIISDIIIDVVIRSGLAGQVRKDVIRRLEEEKQNLLACLQNDIQKEVKKGKRNENG